MNNMYFNNVYKKRLTYGMMYLAYGAIPLTHWTIQQPAYGAYGKVTAGSRNQEIKNYAQKLGLALKSDTSLDEIRQTIDKILIEQLLEVLETKDFGGDFLLHTAALKKHGAAFMDALLNAKISGNDLITLLELTGQHGETPLHNAANSVHGAAFMDALLKARISGNDLIELLKITGGSNNDTPLHIAANSAHGVAFMDALKNFKIDENALAALLEIKNRSGETPLHVAANSVHIVAFINALQNAEISKNTLMSLLENTKNTSNQTPLDYIKNNKKEQAVGGLIIWKEKLNDVPDEFQGHSKPKQNMSVAHLANDSIGEVPQKIEIDLKNLPSNIAKKIEIDLKNLPSNIAQKLVFLQRNLKLCQALRSKKTKNPQEMNEILDEADRGDPNKLLNLAQRNLSTTIFKGDPNKLLNLAQKKLDKATFEGIEKEYIDTIKAIQYRQKLCDAVLKKFWATKATDDVSSELSKAKPEELYKSPNWTTKKLLEKLLELERSEKTNPANGKPKEKDSVRIEREVQGYFQSSTVRKKAPKKKELPDSLKGLKKGKILGAGSFGEVQLFIDPDNGKKYAVKFSKSLNMNSFNGMTKEAYVARWLKEETEGASALHDIAVNQFAGAKVIIVPDPNNASEMIPVLIQEAVGEADLTTIIYNTSVSNPLQRVHLGLQVIAEVKALGDNGLVHGDLKPENIRIANDGLHIIDWGGVVPEGYVGPPRCTLYYSAPEDICRIPDWSDASISASQDVYSVGIILAQLLFGKLCQIGQKNNLTHLLALDTLFLEEQGTTGYTNSYNFRMKNQITPKNLYQAFQEVNKRLTDHYPNDETNDTKNVLKEMAVIIADCLQLDPLKRPTAAEVYERWTQVYIKMTDPWINPNTERQQSSNQY